MAGAPLLDLWRFKIFSLLDGPGADVLTFILQHGTNSHNPRVHLDTHLTVLPVSSTANYCLLNDKDKKKAFNPSELRQIQRYPSWDNFDITLLFKAIRLACEDIARLNDDAKWKDQNEMEGLITKIKDERNVCVHEREQVSQSDFLAKAKELEDIYMKALAQAKVRYQVHDKDFTRVRDQVLEDISFIKTSTAKVILERDIKDALHSFKEESKKYLQSLYQKSKYFNPLSFLSGVTLNIDIHSLFCEVFLINKTDETKTGDIDSLDLLTLTKSIGQTTQLLTCTQGTQSTQGKKPQFVLISGEAGSGKTTLLNFIWAEWLRDAHDCCIKYLNEFDIVLRILCREKDGPSLQDFLQQALPNTFVGIKDSLVALLKECRVLFLIDGLDELSPGSSSYKLVIDILNEGKDVTEFTVICTSRPETVSNFLAMIPDRFQRWKMEMKGIGPEHRTNFVLKYYDVFAAQSSKDRDNLKYLMECTGWMEHMGLPLNLLFVATLFYTDPGSLKNNNTQTNLYLAIHDWCVQKLQHRIEGDPEGGRDSMALKMSIKKVLEMLYQVALQGLLEDRLSLSEEEVQQLKDCCHEENLPSKDIMGAFLCLREHIVRLIPDKKYSPAHKSLQEFWAANYITNHLIGASAPRQNVIQHSFQHTEDRLLGTASGDIRRLLQNKDPRKFKNLLLHVAGLLSQPDVPSLPRAIQEIVDLLAKSGMEDIEDWLRLLQDTEVNSNVLERVAQHITKDSNVLERVAQNITRDSLGSETVRITDTTVTSAAALMPLIPHKDVRIDLQRRETDTSKLCLATANHSCTWLWQWHHYKQPILPPASDPLLLALPRSKLRRFIGHLSADGIMLLQDSWRLKYLRLAVSCDQDANIIVSTLAAATASLHHLSILLLHVPVKAVTTEVFTTPLPDVLVGRGNPGVWLLLSGVDEQLLEETCTIIAALKPREAGYRVITFPGCTIEAAMWTRLLNLLGDAEVRVREGVWVLKTIMMTRREECELRHLAWTRGLGHFMRLPEDPLW